MTKKEIVRQILRDEVRGDIESALKKMHPEYSMTWVYKSVAKETLFFRVSGAKLRKLMKQVYKIKGRSYEIKHLVEGPKIVVVELIERYGTHVTPLVLILEFKGNKIIRGRHYCDPRLSYEKLTKEQLSRIYK